MNHLRLYLTLVAIVATNFSSLVLFSKTAHADSKLILPDRATISTQQIDRLSQQPATDRPSRNFVSQGTEIFLNGKTLNIPWGQWQVGNSVRLGISDTALDRQMGVELFNNSNYQTQPINWYATQRSRAISLNAKLSQQYRYLDITDLAKSSGWQWQIFGGKLQLNTPATRVISVRRETIPKNGKIAVTLDRHTPWKLSQTPTEGYLTIEANADPALLAQFNAPPPIVDPNNLDPDDDPTAQKLEYKVTSNNNQTIIQFPIVKGQRARVKLLSPTNLEVSIDPNLATIPDREINWAPGLKWRQKWVKLGTNNFPVTYLEIDPRQKGIKIRSILAQDPSLVGTNHLIKFAPPTQVAAAINGGYFNRNNRMPLGALKRDGKWLSSPILNRGAIGWNDGGQMRIARLQMQETLNTSKGEQLSILALNSAYAQTGISRYTSDWGKTYSPIQADELIVTVQSDPRLHVVRERVTQITPGNAAGSINIPIPVNGYLLALRGQPELSESMSIGTDLTLQSQITPPEFDTYTQIAAAGPWLVQSGKVVLDAKSENFGAAFSKEAAVRSAIGSLPTGKMIIVAAHNRAGGKGPTLAEMAQLLQQMGTVDALNLDGGSSTSLYLGGQLIDRASATAARVHNAIGISFAEPQR
ncbi:phosphodiester glycosidase family protein [Chamaesiphon sp. VAR_48_metabat_135_sub]|uniref:phosphodiester glycosidase family protein n=1 Tax=Chamaesiphon sp. VAR_48_metabat_135_sub TaxID=2964699 RepID=UPI00286A874F|nr:phosphodiester glycosidase family protein [Chamaesiphon sp. VAR_48_metabat_135_sub]